jgi:hypothetical protein
MGLGDRCTEILACQACGKLDRIRNAGGAKLWGTAEKSIRKRTGRYIRRSVWQPGVGESGG